MTKRLSKIEKFLLILEGLIDETYAIWYPYKGIGKHFRKYEGSFARALSQARRHGYLEVVEKEGRKQIRFTTLGRLKIFGKQRFRKQWDGRWRILVFDIEEKRKITRNLFRQKLKDLGFKPIQKSVWISPYDVSEKIEELLDLLNLEENVEYFIAEAVTHQQELIKKFKLESKLREKSI